jgi:hypothetical protein
MAPPPLKGELVSSWLSRVAAANCISLEELLDALCLVNRWSCSPSEYLDVNLDLVFQLALSEFCRVPSELISQMTLVRQFPGIPQEMFLSSPNFFSTSGYPIICHAGYAFCPDCLYEAAQMGDPAYIPAAWSLALLTHCRAHSRPLRSRCPICFVEEPLLFPTPPQKSGFFCRSCGFDFSVNFIREKPAPRIKAVMALEDAYLKAVWGTAPDPRWLRGISSRDFRLLVESLVVLFSSRLPGETHILAAFLLDHEVAERYHFCRHAAEAKLPYFSWHWRFAVIFSIAKVIFGEHADPTCSAFCPDSSQVFFELLQNLPWEDHIHIFTASRAWPKRVQDDFGRAMKKTREESMSF